MLFKCLNVYQTHVSVAKWVTMYTVIPQNFVLKCLKKTQMCPENYGFAQKVALTK